MTSKTEKMTLIKKGTRKWNLNGKKERARLRKKINRTNASLLLRTIFSGNRICSNLKKLITRSCWVQIWARKFRKIIRICSRWRDRTNCYDRSNFRNTKASRRLQCLCNRHTSTITSQICSNGWAILNTFDNNTL